MSNKPTEPGEYIIHHHKKDGGEKYHVMVSRRGRGLSVYCRQFNQTVPMSEIVDDEFAWWEKIFI